MGPLNRSRTIATIVVLVCVLTVVLFCHFEAWKHHEIQIEQPESLEIQPGDNFTDIVSKLRSQGLIQNVRYFELLARMANSTGSIQAGEYSFSGTHTPETILQYIVQGNVVTRWLTLPEGGVFTEFLHILNSTSRIEFDLANRSVESALAGLNVEQTWTQIPSTHGEGWFFPDTYQYTTSMQASEVLKIAHRKMLDELHEVWTHRDPATPLSTPYELLILASIIEKESGVVEDQKQISGVFSRRLSTRMRLQADPTVIYGLGDSFDGNLTRAHLNMDQPYNTYRNYGLPPTPIAAPSRAALQAAANPAQGDALYFVARGDGTSEFSATLEEHNRAVRKYQRNQTD